MAALCRRSESGSRPTLLAELVRKYATAGVRTLAMHHAARPPPAGSQCCFDPAPAQDRAAFRQAYEGAKSRASGGRATPRAPPLCVARLSPGYVEAWAIALKAMGQGSRCR